MIYIVSPGRSGSAWLSAVFSALGLKVRHESVPVIEEPDVLSDTSWMWNRGALVNRLEQRNRVKITDTIIILDRPREEIERSIAKLVGHKNWDRNFDAWEKLKNDLWNKGLTQILKAGFKFNYKDLFEPEFPKYLRAVLTSSGHRRDIHEIQRVWDLFRHLRITNKTSEEETVQSYGYGIGN